MTLLRRQQTSLIRRFSPGRFGRWALFSVVALAVFVLSRSSLAEFEQPSIDPTNALTNVEFRNVWATLRSTDYVSSALYEAYAVGIDKSITSCPSGQAVETCNGVFYFYNGLIWSRIASDKISSATFNGATEIPYSLNAVVGQQDIGEGNPNPMWVVGPNAKIGQMQYYSLPGGAPYSTYEPNFSDETITSLVGSGKENDDFYTIDAEQFYNGQIMAGGERGLVARVGAKGATPTAAWSLITPTIKDTIGNTLASLESTNQSIVRIRYAADRRAYVVTSTFPTSRYNYGENCSGQTTRIYRTGQVTAVDYDTWTLLATIPNTCGYSLAFGTPASFGVSGTIPKTLWTATSNGVYQFAEATSALTGPINGTSGTPTYGISAVTDRGGSGVDLLANGNFANTTSGLPDGWGFTASHTGNAAAGCTRSNDFSMVGGALQVYQAPDTPGGCIPTTPRDPYYTSAAYQYIDLTTFEGQKFRITGHVKVEFPTIPAGYSTAQAPQGGVAIGCAGAVNNDSDTTSNHSPTTRIDCTLNNRSYIATSDPLAPGQSGTTVEKDIDITISREDAIFSSITKKKVTVGPYNMFLQITCEATYGAKVTCSNLRVEEINTPPTTPRNKVVVFAAGGAPGASQVLINEDALNGSSPFTAETTPATTLQAPLLTSLYGINIQHVYAVGSSTSGQLIYSRTPSTLKGSIWVGAVSPIDNSTGTSPVGPISVSCVDDRGLLGTDKTLCQRSPDSYGVSLEVTKNGTLTTGVVSGHAWFGRPLTVTNNTESLNLGSCLNPPPIINALQPYNLTGICHTATRRCYSDTAKTTDSTKSCLSDFDCYGRCALDQGFLCTSDADCSQTGVVGLTSTSTNALQTSPISRLKCGNTNASPLACSSLGWLSFNPSDIGATAPGGGSSSALYNTLYQSQNITTGYAQRGAHELSGWARFMSLASSALPQSAQTGWVHLRGTSQTPITINATYGTSTLAGVISACRNCGGSATTGTMTCAFCQGLSGQSCVPPNTPVSPTANDPSCFYICEGTGTDVSNPLVKCATSSDCTNKGTGSCKAPGVCSGTSTLCTSNADCGSGSTCQNYGAICNSIHGGSTAQCSGYGVNLDTESGQFYGKAWSEDFGWLDFSPVSYGGNRIIQTKLGDIYAQGNIGSATTSRPQTTSSCNATYLISAGGSITNFCSATGVGSAGNLFFGASTIPLASPLNGYANILGRFDVKGIETNVGGNKNKYGSPIVTDDNWDDIATQINANDNNRSVLDGKVYVINGNATINSPITFNNGSDITHNGGGIIIVNGNLIINSSIAYGTTSISDLRQLASATFIVKGNMEIDSSVTASPGSPAVVGAFYVNGELSTAPTPTSSTSPLQINGLLIAKTLHFNRQTSGTFESPQPSELIIYDGRLQSNPMPGMTDFASTLPSTTVISP